MKALVKENDLVEWKKMDEPHVKPGQVKIRVKVAGLNHRDLFTVGKETSEAMVVGSDAAGVVEAIGDDVRRFKIGDEVIVNPGLDWYANTPAPAETFAIYDGAMADKLVISEEQLERKPNHLNWEEAGVLALSALTGYRALFTKGELKAGDTVFIPGAGGGVVSYLIMFAKKAGARVIVTSRDAKKRQAAVKLGCDRALDTADDWEAVLQDEKIDLVIDSVGGATFNRSLAILKKGGRMVVFGSSTNDVTDLNLRDFFYGQFQLFGSTMGSREELRQMLTFITDEQIYPVVDCQFPIEAHTNAFAYLERGKQFGKVALVMNSASE